VLGRDVVQRAALVVLAPPAPVLDRLEYRLEVRNRDVRRPMRGLGHLASSIGLVSGQLPEGARRSRPAPGSLPSSPRPRPSDDPTDRTRRPSTSTGSGAPSLPARRSGAAESGRGTPPA